MKNMIKFFIVTFAFAGCLQAPFNRGVPTGAVRGQGAASVVEPKPSHFQRVKRWFARKKVNPTAVPVMGSTAYVAAGSRRGSFDLDRLAGREVKAAAASVVERSNALHGRMTKALRGPSDGDVEGEYAALRSDLGTGDSDSSTDFGMRNRVVSRLPDPLPVARTVAGAGVASAGTGRNPLPAFRSGSTVSTKAADRLAEHKRLTVAGTDALKNAREAKAHGAAADEASWKNHSARYAAERNALIPRNLAHEALLHEEKGLAEMNARLDAQIALRTTEARAAAEKSNKQAVRQAFARKNQALEQKTSNEARLRSIQQTRKALEEALLLRREA